MLSSAILYGAIVVIWAGVLIPRWLRRDTPAVTEMTETETVTPPSHAEDRADVADDPGPAEVVTPRPIRRPDAERLRVLRARRRLLGMLVALALASAALAVLKLAAWWVVLPPTVMLLCYLGLLREASKADAERRTTTAAAAERREATVPRQAEPERRPAPMPVPVPVAEVIDITARVTDDPYDQYTDARRAVGGN